MLTIHKDSHTDHLTHAQLMFVIQHYENADGPFIDTIELPPGVGKLSCGLYGPTMGDGVIPSARVFFKPRGTRKYDSRLIDAPPRPTDLITVIAIAHDGQPCVLATAYGGPQAPKETDDPRLTLDESHDSLAFWAEHALSAHEGA